MQIRLWQVDLQRLRASAFSPKQMYCMCQPNSRQRRRIGTFFVERCVYSDQYNLKEKPIKKILQHHCRQRHISMRHRLTTAVKLTAKVERIFRTEITKGEILTDGEIEIFPTCRPRERLGRVQLSGPLLSVHSHNQSGGKVQPRVNLAQIKEVCQLFLK